MKSTPFARWLVLGNSAIIVGISAFWLGANIGMIAVTWDPCSGLLGLLLPLAVGSLQYAAAFRKKAKAASIVGVIQLYICVANGIAFLANVAGEIVKGYSITADECIILAFMFLASVYSGFCGWMNLRLGKYLRVSSAEMDQSATNTAGRFQFTLRELLAGVVVVSLMASGAAIVIRSSGKRCEAHVSREIASAQISGLPEGATDVCYYKGARGKLAYQFMIDEGGFLEWANKIRENQSPDSDASDEKIQKGGPFAITLYAGPIPEKNVSATGSSSITFSRGYLYKHSTKDGGLEIGYDMDKRRAYYFRSESRSLKINTFSFR